MAAGTPIFWEGFEKYGFGTVINTTNATSQFALMAGDWTSLSITNATVTFATGLSAGISSGSIQPTALQLVTAANTAAFTLQKSFASTYTRIVGGIRFNQSVAFPSVTTDLMQFLDPSGNIQAGFRIISTGAIVLVQNGGTTVVATLPVQTLGSSHMLEWDITIGAAGAYNVYIDGVSVASGTGNFKASTASTYQTFKFFYNRLGGVATTITIDDLYLNDDTGTPLLQNTVVQTSPVTGDVSTAFTIGQGVLGAYQNNTTGTNAPGANELFLRKFTPSVNMTLNSISCYPSATSATAKFKGCVYSDSSGSPNSRLGVASTDTVGATAGTVLTSALGSTVALTAGTPYWLGFITDTSVALNESDTTTGGSKATNTYTSGAPVTAPAMTTGQPDWMIWGNVTATGSNTYELGTIQSPDNLGDLSYVTSSTVGAEDLFSIASLVGSPTAVIGVAVKGFMRDSDGGARTINLEAKSGGTTGTGSASGFTPTTTYEWLASYFMTDPNTGVAWTVSGVNAADIGYKIAS